MTQLLSVEDAARLLAISPWTVRAYLREGRLVPIRIGRRLLVTELELQRFIDECQAKPLPEAQQEVQE